MKKLSRRIYFEELSVRAQEDIINDLLAELFEEGKTKEKITVDEYLNDLDVRDRVRPLVDQKLRDQFIGIISY